MFEDQTAEKLADEALSAPVARRRRRAVSLLALSDDPRAEQTLLSAVADPADSVRWAAIYGLFERDRTRPAEPILRALAEDGTPVTTLTDKIVTLALPFDILARLLSPDMLLAAFTSATARHRRAYIAIGRRLFAEAVMPLYALGAQDPDRGVRYQVVKAVAEARPSDDRAMLLERLASDPSRAVRRAAARAIAASSH
jgi:hypothetical protein